MPSYSLGVPCILRDNQSVPSGTHFYTKRVIINSIWYTAFYWYETMTGVYTGIAIPYQNADQPIKFMDSQGSWH